VIPKSWGEADISDAKAMRRDATGRSTCPNPQCFPVLEEVSIYNYLFINRLWYEVREWGNV
jgi:hypothetical protein